MVVHRGCRGGRERRDKPRAGPTGPLLHQHPTLFEQCSDAGEWARVCFLRNVEPAQNVAQVSSGSVLSLHNGIPAVMDNFSYPLNINVTYTEITNTSVTRMPA